MSNSGRSTVFSRRRFLDDAVSLCRIALSAGCHDESTLRRELKRGLRRGIKMEVVREVLLQLHLLVGYPRMIQAFFALEEYPGRRLRERRTSRRELRRRGWKAFREVYGDQAEPLFRRLRECHPDLGGWVIEDAYGKVLSRPFLATPMREGIAFVLLAAQRMPAQLYSHMRGCLRLGWRPRDLRRLVERMEGLFRPDAKRLALAMLSGVRSGSGEEM